MKRLGAVVNTAFPKPQITRLSSAIQNQNVYPVLSHHMFLSAPSPYLYTGPQSLPFGQGSKERLKRHNNTLKTFQVSKMAVL